MSERAGWATAAETDEAMFRKEVSAGKDFASRDLLRDTAYGTLNRRAVEASGGFAAWDGLMKRLYGAPLTYYLESNSLQAAVDGIVNGTAPMWKPKLADDLVVWVGKQSEPDWDGDPQYPVYTNGGAEGTKAEVVGYVYKKVSEGCREWCCDCGVEEHLAEFGIDAPQGETNMHTVRAQFRRMGIGRSRRITY